MGNFLMVPNNLAPVPDHINWTHVDVENYRTKHFYSDDYTKLLDLLETHFKGYNYPDEIGMNPYYDSKHFDLFHESKVASSETKPKYERDFIVGQRVAVSILCAYCDPIVQLPGNQWALNLQFHDVDNGDYDTHMIEHHGIFPNDEAAPQPFVGSTRGFKYEDGHHVSNSKLPEMCTICPHHLDDDEGQACLAMFPLRDNVRTPLAEYFNHFYEIHHLHKKEPSDTYRYRSIEYGDDPYTEVINPLIVSHPIFHAQAQMHLTQYCLSRNLQPFYLWSLPTLIHCPDPSALDYVWFKERFDYFQRLKLITPPPPMHEEPEAFQAETRIMNGEHLDEDYGHLGFMDCELSGDFSFSGKTQTMDCSCNETNNVEPNEEQTVDEADVPMPYEEAYSVEDTLHEQEQLYQEVIASLGQDRIDEHYKHKVRRAIQEQFWKEKIERYDVHNLEAFKRELKRYWERNPNDRAVFTLRYPNDDDDSDDEDAMDWILPKLMKELFEKTINTPSNDTTPTESNTESSDPDSDQTRSEEQERATRNHAQFSYDTILDDSSSDLEEDFTYGVKVEQRPRMRKTLGKWGLKALFEDLHLNP